MYKNLSLTQWGLTLIGWFWFPLQFTFFTKAYPRSPVCPAGVIARPSRRAFTNPALHRTTSPVNKVTPACRTHCPANKTFPCVSHVLQCVIIAQHTSHTFPDPNATRFLISFHASTPRQTTSLIHSDLFSDLLTYFNCRPPDEPIKSIWLHNCSFIIVLGIVNWFINGLLF